MQRISGSNAELSQQVYVALQELRKARAAKDVPRQDWFEKVMNAGLDELGLRIFEHQIMTELANLDGANGETVVS